MFIESSTSIFGLKDCNYNKLSFTLKKGVSSTLFIWFSCMSKNDNSFDKDLLQKIMDNKEDSFIVFWSDPSFTTDSHEVTYSATKIGKTLKSILGNEFKDIADLEIWFLGSAQAGVNAMSACFELGQGSCLINASQVQDYNLLEKLLNSKLNKCNLQEGVLKESQSLTHSPKFYICSGIDNDLFWHSLSNSFGKYNEFNDNLQFIPIRGGDDYISQADYSDLVDALLNNDKVLERMKSLQLAIDFFKNKTSLFCEYLLPTNDNFIDNIDASSIKDRAYKILLNNTNLNFTDYKSVLVDINGFEGIPITIYAKNDKNRIISKGGRYRSYHHSFELNNIDTKSLSILTVFMMFSGRKITLNLSINKLKKISSMFQYDDETNYLEYLNLEYSTTAQRVIRSSNKKLIKNTYIAPSFIDSSDSRVVARNGIGYSFRSCLTNDLLKYHLPGNMKILNGYAKKDTAEFLNQCGYNVPTIYAYDVKVEEVLNYDQCVIKPISGAGSRGIFIKNKDGYFDLRDKELLVDYESFEKKYRSYSKLNILIEELISNGNEIARDIKVFSFYGKAPIALEIVRSNDKNYYCYYNENLEIINHCQDRERNFFEGDGFDKNIFSLARDISLLLPTPFMRIDFLVTSSQYRLGELTPIPGFYSRFSSEYDMKLGKEYLLSENRLRKDLLQGKKFYVL